MSQMRYCGDSIPPSHVLSSNEVLIHFQSDSSTPSSGTGFQMEYNPTGKLNTSIKKNDFVIVLLCIQNFGNTLHFKETLYFLLKTLALMRDSHFFHDLQMQVLFHGVYHGIQFMNFDIKTGIPICNPI